MGLFGPPKIVTNAYNTVNTANPNTSQGQRRLGVQSATENYGGRSPFRQAALDTLNSGQGFDWSTLYDPSIYQQPDIAYGDGQDTGRNASEQAFQNVQGIDRTQMVRDALKNFDLESDPILSAQYRQAAQKAAALGSLGSGRLNTSLGDSVSARARDRDVLENQSILDATEGSIADKFNILGAANQRQDRITGQNDAAYKRASDRASQKTALGRQALQDRLALGDQNLQFSQSQLQRALGLGQFGFGNDPSNAYFQQSQGSSQDEARQREQENQLWSTLGQFGGYFLGGPAGGAIGRKAGQWAGGNSGGNGDGYG